MQEFNFDDLDLEETLDNLEKVEEKPVEEKPNVNKETGEVQLKEDFLDLEGIKKEVVEEAKKSKASYSRPKPEEVNAIEKQPKPKTTAVAKPSDKNVQLAQRAIAKITELANLSNQVIGEKEKQIATDIVIATNKAVAMAGYDWPDLDLTNNNYFGNLKRWSKLGVDVTTDHLYADIRKNGKTGKVDIVIKPQYQTIRKLIIKYCTKNIFNFKEDVICRSDEFIKKFDFATGSEKVVDHIYGENRNPNALDDIIGAYVVAFVREKDNSVTQIVTYIDKNRINRAYNSAQTKNVWNNDTKKMVIKTAYWELWTSSSIAPFMKYPDEIIEDLAVINDTSDVEFNQDHKYNNLNSAQNNASSNIGSGDIIDI